MFDKYINFLADAWLQRGDPVYREWWLKFAKYLVKFKNIHKGEDCFIVGNGPSLNKIDVDRLNDYHTFGLNKIYLMFDRVEFRPSYHVAVNSLVIEQSVREFEKLECQTFLSYRPSRQVVKKLDHVNFIMTGGPITFCTNLIGQVNEGWTVTFVAMQIAYYMGFKNVFLVGVDHNFVLSGSPNEQQFLNARDDNHFDPNYFSGNDWHLPDLAGSEISYHLAKFFFERDGRHIYDATFEGKLKIFPKIAYSDALNQCIKKWLPNSKSF